VFAILAVLIPSLRYTILDISLQSSSREETFPTSEGDPEHHPRTGQKVFPGTEQRVTATTALSPPDESFGAARGAHLSVPRARWRVSSIKFISGSASPPPGFERFMRLHSFSHEGVGVSAIFGGSESAQPGRPTEEGDFELTAAIFPTAAVSCEGLPPPLRKRSDALLSASVPPLGEPGTVDVLPGVRPGFESLTLA